MDIACPNCVSIMIAAHWLPPDAAGDAVGAGDEEDWLPGLIAAWQRWNAVGPRELRARRRALDKLENWRQAGARLTSTSAHSTSARGAAWLGHRLIWWPHGIPTGRRLAVLSSRLGRRWDRRAAWCAALRQACAELAAASCALVAAEKTAAVRAVLRAGQLFQVPVLLATAPREGEDLEKWLRAIWKRKPLAPSTGATHTAHLSPSPPSSRAETACLAGDAPLRDRALVGLADDLLVLSVRRNGHVARLLRDCLADRSPTRPAVRIVDDPQLAPAADLREYLRLGATPLRAEPLAPPPVVPTRRSECAVGPRAPIIGVPTPRDWDYLSHWTRAANTAWPDETEDEALDRLLRCDPLADHSAFGALLRIVRERRLRASAATIRGEVPVVCFTAVPLAEWRERRVFRPHRGRWDYERYGISIRRGYLEQCGARPVYYGGDEEWDGLPAAMRPFFQLRRTRGRRGGAMDWTGEREWRHPGELDLSRLAADDALLFVPSQAEALALAETSPWPIVVLAE